MQACTFDFVVYMKNDRRLNHVLQELQKPKCWCFGPSGAEPGIWPPSLWGLRGPSAPKRLERRSRQNFSCFSNICPSWDSKLHFFIRRFEVTHCIWARSHYTAVPGPVIYIWYRNGAIICVYTHANWENLLLWRTGWLLEMFTLLLHVFRLTAEHFVSPLQLFPNRTATCLDWQIQLPSVQTRDVFLIIRNKDQSSILHSNEAACASTPQMTGCDRWYL